MKAKIHSKLRELQKQVNNGGGECARCGKKTDYLTVDHVVPLAIVLLLLPKEESMDDDWNFQAVCRPCNSLKASRLDFNDFRTIPNLKRYIEKAEQYYKS